ncbi:MAG TPA: aminodeoxychorismate/anthranilate synthase component II [Bacteroidales bacterium]|nr:aminodeoxychorismate/anthranilate synthase component II [Bacteroidales bacterium]
MNYRRPKILVVDNYDSFTFNLVEILRDSDMCDFDIEKNDRIHAESVARYDGFLFSPGPGVPADAPVMSELLRKYSRRKGFLGICLGHQAIAETCGLKLQRLDTVRHGVRTKITLVDPADYLFAGVPPEFDVGLYHSWGVYNDAGIDYSALGLKVTALSEDGIIITLAHTRCNFRGVQFHPESYMSEYGPLLVRNWIGSLG